ncbi:MAG: pentapeptide repeat-containing protein [Sulfurimonas sp.]
MKNKNSSSTFFDDLITRYGSHGNSKKNNSSSYNNYQNRDDRKHANAKDIKKMARNIKALNKAVSELYFSDGEYVNLSFRGITAIKVNFIFSDLRNCDFSNTILINCDFTFANLKNCNFSGATLSECLFRHSDIRNCNFSDTDISFCDFTGTHYDCRYS